MVSRASGNHRRLELPRHRAAGARSSFGTLRHTSVVQGAYRYMYYRVTLLVSEIKL